MKGRSMVINGDRWTVVDVAPAAPLAEMVAALLEEEGFIVVTREPGMGDALTHLGSHGLGITYVLVPEADAVDALKLIEETVTDYRGEELDELIRGLAQSEREVEDED